MTTATVTAVTGPAGHDIGPLAAWLGRDLGDGLAIRTVASTPQRSQYAMHRSMPGVDIHDRSTGAQIRSLGLVCLPSAHQHPDTNLAVAFTGHADGRIVQDLNALDALGLHPGHRLVVQALDPNTVAEHVPPPVEVCGPGDLARSARDNVLRSARGSGSRHVLIEAGAGQTLLDAFATVGLAPWTAAVEQLDLWLMVDAARIQARVTTLQDAEYRAALFEALCVQVAQLVATNGGGQRDGQYAPALWLAVRNAQLLIPGLTGVTQDDFEQADVSIFNRPEPDPYAEAEEQLNSFLIALERRASVAVGAIGTGPDADSPWFDLRGSR